MNVMRRGAASGHRRFSIRTQFAALVFAVLSPIVPVAWWLASQSATSERNRIEQSILQKATEISMIIDREVVSVQNMLVALASSPHLQAKNLEAFHHQASQVAREIGTQIVLRDPQRDEQLVNTALPWGEKLLRGVPSPRYQAEEEARQSRKPVVSNLFFGPLTNRYVATVIVPVGVNGSISYFLAVGIPSDRFLEIVRQVHPDPNYIVTVIDRGGAFVARTDRHTELLGTRSDSNVDKLNLAPSLGNWKGKNFDGIDFNWGYVRSELTGWLVSVGLPERVMQTRSRLIIASFAGVGSGALVIAVIGGYVIGGRISRSAGALGIDRKPTSEEFEVLFESAPNGVVVVDGNGAIALLNERVELTFGYDRGELIGQPLEVLVPDRFRDEHAALRKKFVNSPETRSMGSGRNLFGRKKDGTDFPIEVGLNPISTSAGKLVMATVVDITARKRSAEQLSAALVERDDLRRRFVQAQEQERLRLARELHDQTGQSLTAALLELKSIELVVDEKGKKRIRLLRTQMEEMGKTLHRVAWELRPASIDELGLANALANYISDWSEQSGIDSDFYASDCNLDNLSEEVRTTIYRIIQEGLTNVAKHARNATNVSIVIERYGEMLRLMIEDNGSGFDVNLELDHRGDRYSGLGLAGMRERLSLIGGDLEIEYSVGTGTTIFARLPVHRERDAA